MEVDPQGNKQTHQHEQGGQMPEQGELANYKGIYYGDTNEKYMDPQTGAHFRFKDLSGRINLLQKNRINLLNGIESLFPDITEDMNFSSEEEESIVAAEAKNDSQADIQELAEE
jgi:hypothetical protein